MRQTKSKHKGCFSVFCLNLWVSLPGIPQRSSTEGPGGSGQHLCNTLTPDNANKPNNKWRREGKKSEAGREESVLLPIPPWETPAQQPSIAACHTPPPAATGPHHPSNPSFCKVSFPPHAPKHMGETHRAWSLVFGAYLWSGWEPDRCHRTPSVPLSRTLPASVCSSATGPGGFLYPPRRSYLLHLLEGRRGERGGERDHSRYRTKDEQATGVRRI